MREKHLMECLISTAAGAVIAAVLCAELPGIERGGDMLVCFGVFWFMALVAVWNCFEIKDRVTNGLDIDLFDDRKRIFRARNARGAENGRRCGRNGGKAA